MNRDEQSLIQTLFGKLSDAERSAPPRDPEAETFIRDSVERQPGAPYYMAQTIIIQEQALEAAQARIQALEAQASQPKAGGGFLSSLFGGGAAAAARPATQAAYGQSAHGRTPQAGGYGQPAPGAGPWNGGAQAAPGGRMGGGGGFMAGAAQTAMGVAGGMMLGSMLSNAFSDPAAAVEGAVADAGNAAEAEVASATEDMGGDFGGFDEA